MQKEIKIVVSSFMSTYDVYKLLFNAGIPISVRSGYISSGIITRETNTKTQEDTYIWKPI